MESQVTFGLGLFGAGKTYVAVVMAIKALIGKFHEEICEYKAGGGVGGVARFPSR